MVSLEQSVMLASKELMRLLALRDQREVITIHEMLRNYVDVKKIVVCHKCFSSKTAWGFSKSFWACKLSFESDTNDPDKRDELPTLMLPNLF